MRRPAPVGRALRWTVLACLTGLMGCGYALEGRGIAVDPTIKRIGVPLFKDLSGKPGLDQKITEQVIEELLKRGRFDVVQESTGVDAIVEGTILSYRATPVGFSSTGGSGKNVEASRYAIALTAQVRYAKVGAKDAIWENPQLTVRDETDVGDDPNAFFDREDQVLDRLGTNFARTLVSQMLEAF